MTPDPPSSKALVPRADTLPEPTGERTSSVARLRPPRGRELYAIPTTVLVMLAIAGALGLVISPPALALLGVIAVAFVTAVEADMRQDKVIAADAARSSDQLAHEVTRMTAELEGQQTRMTVQLEHERRLADVADLRVLLDEVATTLYDAETAYEEACNAALNRGFKPWPEVEPGELSPPARVAEYQKMCGRLASRIAIRVGDGHAITVACEEVAQFLYGEAPTFVLAAESDFEVVPANERTRVRTALMGGPGKLHGLIAKFVEASHEHLESAGKPGT